MTYLYEYDNPYTVLAHAIVGLYRPSDVRRMLEEDAYLRAEVQRETRAADIGGLFLDCIIEDILAHKQRMEYVHELDKLAEYFYNSLDKKRLRKEILKVLQEIGIEVS